MNTLKELDDKIKLLKEIKSEIDHEKLEYYKKAKGFKKSISIIDSKIKKMFLQRAEIEQSEKKLNF